MACSLACTFFGLGFLISLILQCIGFFTSDWVSWDECEHQGLFFFSTSRTKNECSGKLEESLGTQSSSLFVYGAIVLYAIYDSKSKHETDMETHIGAFFVAYLVAGIFSLVGCGMMAKLDIPAEFTYGRSYYFCLGSGILAIVQVTIATACCVCKTCECCECPEQSSSPPRTYVSNRAANDEVNNGYVSSAEGNELSYGVNTGVCDGVIVGNMEIEQTELTTV
ncbi:uncharacterized protein [Argopecten irradians]|uniref:uncharacterized protein n=1 Tax=Argopecten irradians TaxID=31199 RepID=UPI00371B7298